VKLLLTGNADYITGRNDAAFNKILTKGALKLPLSPDKRKVLEVRNISDAKGAFPEFFVKCFGGQYPHDVL
jgi:hypothetical protein